MIVDTGLGDQLQFTNLFAWHACYKFRDFCCDVYARVREMGLVSSSSEIRTDVELPLSEIAVFNDPGGEDWLSRSIPSPPLDFREAGRMQMPYS